MPNSQYLPQQLEALKDNIDHIVVLMLENRSFDNLLGWLYEDGAPNNQEFEGLHSNMWNPLDNIDAEGNPFTEQVFVRKNGADYKLGRKTVKCDTPDFTLPNPDPGEGFADTTFQLYGTYKVSANFPPIANNQGFVNNYKNAQLYGSYTYQDGVCDPREIMTCYTPDQVPVLSTLAKKYAVCDHWFCSVPSQTLPNRDFFHAAQSNGHVNNKPDSYCDAKTIFTQIQDEITKGNKKDLSWKIYSGTNQKGPFSLTRIILTELNKPSFDPNFKSIDEFYKDAKAGTLPSYCFLEPQFHDDKKTGVVQNDMHPPNDIRKGEQLIADVYNAVISSDKWKNTLLVITFDEHGGCFDHVPPPNYCAAPEVNKPAGQNGFKFNRLGVRVPTILISPLIAEGTVARPEKSVYEHTSIIKTVQECFGLTGNLTNRDKYAVDVSGVLTLKEPRTDAEPIIAPPAGEHVPSEVNDLHRIMAATLAKYLGKPIPSDETLIEEMGKMYHEHFKRTKD